jgi:hypothetical protein
MERLQLTFPASTTMHVMSDPGDAKLRLPAKRVAVSNEIDQFQAKTLNNFRRLAESALPELRVHDRQIGTLSFSLDGSLLKPRKEKALF